MASLIPGFEYDIFISYRQKDNRGERWVSEFVEALKTELESTFKEEISVYFDVNPHDGLLETHDVGESLKEKLKCLVLIPIISRTYCDSNSFAWEHEFRAFVEQASKDLFGLKVRLPGGNVASRILPVQLHDLDSQDKILLESVLGGVLRGIEFIYKEPGVNRPLRPVDDRTQNLVKTDYRNQVNKVANAIKEIIAGLKNSYQPGKEIREYTDEVKSFSGKNQKMKIIAGSAVLLVLILSGYFFFHGLVQSDKQIEKSIAVLPFADVSPDKNQEYLGDGLADDIISSLSGVDGLKVIGRTSSFQFKGKNVDLREIGEKLGVGTVLEGSVQKSQNKLRVTVTLIDVKDGTHIWSQKWDREITDIFQIQDEIASFISAKLKVTFLKKPGKMDLKVNPEAYELYLQARQFYHSGQPLNMVKAKGFLLKSIAIDNNFSSAYATLASTYRRLLIMFPPSENEKKQLLSDSVLYYAQKALSLNPEDPAAYIAMANWHSDQRNWIEVDKMARKAIELNPGASEKNRLALFLSNMGYREEANLLVQEALLLEPLSPEIKASLLSIMMLSGKFDETIITAKKYLQLDSNNVNYWTNLAFAYVGKKQYKDALNAWTRQHESYGNKELADIYRSSDFKEAMMSWHEMAKTNKVISPNELTKAVAYAMLEDKDNTLKHLELALANNENGLVTIKLHWLFDFIRNEPRFKKLYRKLNFDAYDEYRKKFQIFQT